MCLVFAVGVLWCCVLSVDRNGLVYWLLLLLWLLMQEKRWKNSKRVRERLIKMLPFFFFQKGFFGQPMLSASCCVCDHILLS